MTTDNFEVHGTVTGRFEGKRNKMHQTYIVPGTVDGQVAHDQAWKRLVDVRTGGEPTIVHDHRYQEECNKNCRRYHVCTTTEEPGAHSIAETCPLPAVEVTEEVSNG